ncbi:MAG: hypothetical protein OYG31_02035 [Candidatus Kaiserbacteria bacterium]|nr:hypothetical protein [Candidatus Kaiserbacteria bacterium]
MRTYIPMFVLFIMGCSTSVSVETEGSVIGTWKHESYQEPLRSTLISQIEIRDDKTFSIRETIKPIPDMGGGIHYLISANSISTIIAEYEGTWEEDSKIPTSFHLTFSGRSLFFDGTVVEQDQEILTTFFWELVVLRTNVAYQFLYAFTDSGNLVLFFSDLEDSPPLYLTFFDGGNGSLFARQ